VARNFSSLLLGIDIDYEGKASPKILQIRDTKVGKTQQKHRKSQN
jgi:hypothetical protein